MINPETWYGAIIRADESQITVSSGAHEQHYFGSFSYHGPEDSRMLFSGQVNRTSYYQNGSLYYDISGGPYDAIEVEQYIDANDIAGLFRNIIFAGNDTISGSDGDDSLGGSYGNDVIYGNGGSDFILDTRGSDVLHGGAGDDFFIVDGDDVVYGDSGTDSIIAPHLASQYSYEGNLLRYWSDKTVELHEVEHIGFGFYLGSAYGVNVSLPDLVDPDGKQGPETSHVVEQLNKLSDLYIAYFGRAPDTAGLSYWFKEIYSDTLTFAETAISFSSQTEYQSAYPERSTNTDLINTIYQNMFNRSPDQAGFSYWKNELDNGMARDSFILSVINGAYSPTGGAEDKALLTNKHDVSLYYAEQSSLNPNESFDDSINILLNEVTSNNGTVTTAQQVIDHAFDNDALTLTGIVNDQGLWDSFWGS
jgi:hypothetical protein